VDEDVAADADPKGRSKLGEFQEKVPRKVLS